MNTITTRERLGRIGVWSMELRFGEQSQALEAAAELDDLGYGTLWIPGGVGGDVLGDIDRLLSATGKAVIATGILNIWKHQPEEVSAWWKKQPSERQARILLGLGVSHGPLIGETYKAPLATMRHYLTQLSALGLPPSSVCLAALGPKMLELARDKTAGAHPYLVPPRHSAWARNILGPDALLAPEQGVVLESDPIRQREICGQTVEQYRRLPNYVNSWRRLGISDEDINNGTDRLFDELFASGEPERIAERVNAHFSAGADHVCLQVLTGAERPDVSAALVGWRKLAGVLFRDR